MEVTSIGVSKLFISSNYNYSSSNFSEKRIEFVKDYKTSVAKIFYEIKHIKYGISRTDIRIERTGLQERDNVIDLALRAVHLPVTTNKKFASHFSPL
ncbi:hypothetical protein X777_06415 [Ooceraea biroi]|uniref:Uncharacterized protein n=1 Tax=Ooceraea biroi TaxID=2015173 RepID=A0A026WCD2_OOCBI|nr:hypothetical protein X777_06415 [Ooceraea biroi]